MQPPIEGTIAAPDDVGAILKDSTQAGPVNVVAAAREMRSKVLGDRKPTSTLIVGGLSNPAWKIEIEGIAVA